VEVTLNYAPQNWHIFPPIAEGVQTTNDRFLRIKAKTLNKREFFRVSLFDAIGDLPLVVSVRWDGGVAKQVPMGPQQIFPYWVRSLILSFLVLGVISFIFIVIRAMLFVFD